MQVVGGLECIISDHFKPYRVAVDRNRLEIPHALWVAALPIALAILLAIYASQFVAANAGAVIAIYAVMASVMTAIMPTINSLIGALDRTRIEALKTGSTTSEDNIEETRVLIAKAEIVRELYAAVAWSVIVLCASLLPLLIVCYSAFQGDTKTPAIDIGETMRVIRMVLVGTIGFAGASSLIALIQIVSGVHLMNRHNQSDIESNLKVLNKRFRL